VIGPWVDPVIARLRNEPGATRGEAAGDAR
jgi:hypothetical protein